MIKSTLLLSFAVRLMLGLALISAFLSLLAIGAGHVFLNDWEFVFTAKAKNDGNSTIYIVDGERHLVHRVTDSKINSLSPSWSPATNQVVYVSNVTGTSQIYGSGLDGHARQLTSGTYSHTLPSWSPDSKNIAYISHETPGGEIYISDADGNNSHLVPLDMPVDSMPRWSPDGTRLLFASTDKYHHNITLDGAITINETLTLNAYDASHLPDGSHLSAETNVYTVTLDGNLHPLTESLAFNAYDPVWSPDGQDIVFPVDDSDGTNIYLLNGGGNPQRISQGSQLNRCPVWSPDSRHIALVSQQGGITGLFVMDADGSNRRMIVKSMGSTLYQPIWSPDNRFVAFVLTEKGQNKIYGIDINDGSRRLLSPAVPGTVILDKICYSN